MQKLFFVAILLISFTAKAQHVKVPDTAGYRIIEENKQAFPKFYKLFHQLLENEPLLKQVNFINKKGKGPGFANPSGTVTLDLDYFINKKPRFNDDRLIVILYHEVGHLHYYNNTPRAKWTPEESEKAAFEYSLLKTKEMAVNKDCAPLKTGLHFMLLRSQSNETSDPHVRALKRMVNEPLYAEYVAYQKEKCK
ncbi:MAG: hypothetical protein REI64_02570 [Pedobacter sp.]|uniref:hypothetical protein n=1 Tax=Pedobacter sp. TaxID=1411316 RepID=UPI002809C39C|nr:hypothetical protein [Pedobacter sp.]MDQ8003653.1 hypothetical protein [Pedobacter sp.]